MILREIPFAIRILHFLIFGKQTTLSLPFFQVRVVDEKDEIIGIGEDGEIQIKTVSLLKTYRKQDDLYRKFITPDGFARTG